VAAEHQKQGVSPQETRQRLKIDGARSIYEGFHY